MEYVNVKIRSLNNEQLSCSSCGIGWIHGKADSRLLPGEVVRVPIEVARKQAKQLELTLEKPTRPRYWRSDNHRKAWQQPDQMVLDVSPDFVRRLREEVQKDLDEEVRSVPAPAEGENEPEVETPRSSARSKRS